MFSDQRPHLRRNFGRCFYCSHRALEEDHFPPGGSHRMTCFREKTNHVPKDFKPRGLLTKNPRGKTKSTLFLQNPTKPNIHNQSSSSNNPRINLWNNTPPKTNHSFFKPQKRIVSHKNWPPFPHLPGRGQPTPRGYPRRPPSAFKPQKNGKISVNGKALCPFSISRNQSRMKSKMPFFLSVIKKTFFLGFSPPPLSWCKGLESCNSKKFFCLKKEFFAYG